jgi:hypothetical protein
MKRLGSIALLAACVPEPRTLLDVDPTASEVGSDDVAVLGPGSAAPESTSPEDEPSTSGEDEPSTSAEDEPSTSAEDQPSTSAEDAPSTSAEDEPPTSPEDDASTSAEEEPSATTAGTTSASSEGAPTAAVVSSIRAWARGSAMISTADGSRVAIGMDDRACIVDSRDGTVVGEVDAGGVAQTVLGTDGVDVLLGWHTDGGRRFGWSDGVTVEPLPADTAERIDAIAMTGDDRITHADLVYDGGCEVRFVGDEVIRAPVDVDADTCRDSAFITAAERTAVLRIGSTTYTVADPFVGAPVVRAHPTVPPHRLVAAVYGITEVLFAPHGAERISLVEVVFAPQTWTSAQPDPVSGIAVERTRSSAIVVSVGEAGLPGRLERRGNWNWGWSESLDVPHAGEVTTYGDAVVIDYPGGVDVVPPDTDWDTPPTTTWQSNE